MNPAPATSETRPQRALFGTYDISQARAELQALRRERTRSVRTLAGLPEHRRVDWLKRQLHSVPEDLVADVYDDFRRAQRYATPRGRRVDVPASGLSHPNVIRRAREHRPGTRAAPRGALSASDDPDPAHLHLPGMHTLLDKVAQLIVEQCLLTRASSSEGDSDD
jgi:hypothetical protein